MTAALPELNFHPAWHAQLELAYARAGDATRPVTRRHAGPLRVHKHLYGEGPEVCQHILVHPPGGIAHLVALDGLGGRARAAGLVL